MDSYLGNTTIRGGTRFTGNVASISGGAIDLAAAVKSSITSVTCTANKAELGGAIAITSPSLNERVYDKCVFADNTATDGGAMYMYSYPGSDVITDSAFRGNYASEIQLTSVDRDWMAPKPYVVVVLEVKL